jgi:hypothetical protein
MIYDANKGLAEKALQEAQAHITAIESFPVRVRQEAALAHHWVQPSKMGPPVKYDNETMPQKVYLLLSNRDVIFTQKMIANRLHCGVSTLKEWKAVYPDLSAAIAQGLAEQEGWLATQMATGMKYSASMYAVLKNLHDWSDKIESRTTLDLTEAIRKQATGAKRVQWDRALPDPTQKDAAPIFASPPNSLELNSSPASAAVQQAHPPMPASPTQPTMHTAPPVPLDSTAPLEPIM